jgi:hypothetical protein
MALDILSTSPPRALSKAIHCPACDSMQISYPQITRKDMSPDKVLYKQ